MSYNNSKYVDYYHGPFIRIYININFTLYCTKVELGFVAVLSFDAKTNKKVAKKLRKSLYERFYKVFTDFTNNYVEFSQLESNTM